MSQIIEKMLENCDVKLEVDFNESRNQYMKMAEKVLYTGPIDSYYDFCYGPLEYRSLRFEHELLNTENFQGVAVVNYTDKETPYTRIIEHKHFEFGVQDFTIITREFPLEWSKEIEPYYPINDKKNQELYEKYESLSKLDDKVIFGGRLGLYRYTDMQDTIDAALKSVKKIFD